MARSVVVDVIDSVASNSAFITNCWNPVRIPLSFELIEQRGEPGRKRSRKPSRNWDAVLQAENMGKIGEGRRRTLFMYGIR